VARVVYSRRFGRRRGAGKQLAPHRQRHLAALFFQRPSGPIDHIIPIIHALIRPRQDGAPHKHLFLFEWYDSP